jgi:hypothetical protein
MLNAPGGYAQPGTVNYVEGQVKLDGQSITANKIGSTLVSPGHILQTDDGKAEMLLTPGVFVRLDTHSQVKMISPSISDTRVELLQGRTMLEVAEIEKENHTEVTVGGTSTTVKARGIYEFTASPASARVFEGKAVVEQGSRSDYIHKGEQMALDATNPKLKTRDFNVKKTPHFTLPEPLWHDSRMTLARWIAAPAAFSCAAASAGRRRPQPPTGARYLPAVDRNQYHRFGGQHHHGRPGHGQTPARCRLPRGRRARCSAPTTARGTWW